jgi:hypothetical protein
MGIAKMRFHLGTSGLQGMEARLLAATLLQLPHNTRVVGMEKDTTTILDVSVILLEHRLLKDGAELIGSYQRDVAIIDNGGGDKEIVEVDTFVGLNLKECLVNEFEDVNEEG